MADSTPKQIIDTFIAKVAALEVIQAANAKETAAIPGEVREGAVVMALWHGCRQDFKETGGAGDLTWQWEIHVYANIPNGDLEAAQETLYAAVPAVLSVARSDAFLDALDALEPEIRTGDVQLSDRGTTPDIDLEEEWMMKELLLSVPSVEPPVA
jgi:hypothetical protein